MAHQCFLRLVVQRVEGFVIPSKNAWKSSRCIHPAQSIDNVDSTSELNRREIFSAASAVLGTLMLTPAIVNAAESDGSTVLHIVDYPVKGKCGQADVSEKGAFFAKQFGGMVDGSCDTEGYSVGDGKANGIKEKDQQREYEIYEKPKD